MLINVFNAVEFRRQFVSKDVERYGNQWSLGNGIGKQTGSGQGEKGEKSLRVLHGIQFHRIRSAEKL